jgi:hypothetical protein
MESAYALPLARSFLSGLEMSHVGEGKYGTHLNVYDWQERRILQRIDLGQEGTMPLEIRCTDEKKIKFSSFIRKFSVRFRKYKKTRKKLIGRKTLFLILARIELKSAKKQKVHNGVKKCWKVYFRANGRYFFSSIVEKQYIFF